jgi:hypothetical protein
MNDTTGTDSGGLKGSFGSKGTKVNQIPYGHPQGETIVKEAREKLVLTDIGQKLAKVWDTFRIPVHVVKGNGETGFSIDLNTIYIQTPGTTKAATPEIVLGMVKALREADLEYAGDKMPDPMKDVMAYAAFMHARNMETIVCMCQFVKELTNSLEFTVFLDTLPKLGLNGVYKAYINGASDEEIYIEYAKAYDTMRGN